MEIVKEKKSIRKRKGKMIQNYTIQIQILVRDFEEA